MMAFLEEHPDVVLAVYPDATFPLVESSGGGQFCDTCDFIKPDRTYHCSSCGACVLRMDHHCPWYKSLIARSPLSRTNSLF